MHHHGQFEFKCAQTKSNQTYFAGSKTVREMSMKTEQIYILFLISVFINKIIHIRLRYYNVIIQKLL